MTFLAIAAKRNQEVKTAEQKRCDDIFWEVEAALNDPRNQDLEKAQALCEERNSLIREGKAKNFFFKLAKTPYYMSEITSKIIVVKTEKEVEGEFLFGETFQKKEAIKAKGGKWVADKKGWLVPSEVFEELYTLCNG